MEQVTLGDLMKRLERLEEASKHAFDTVSKAVDDLLWYARLEDIAVLDKVRILGPPPGDSFPVNLLKSPQEKKNQVKISAYTFIPREIDRSTKYPLLVFPHGGVHNNFTSSYAHVIQELLEQGYLIIAPDYRGSTGYGEKLYKLIDYGGLEIEDTLAACNWMIENNDLVDPNRVGILGWSHGGLHSLMNVFNYPDVYKVAYACVPVSDLVTRMGYKGKKYRDSFSVDYHIGKTPYEDIEEYKQRSPAWTAEKLQTPLLIHTTTNDEDVNVLEVEHLIKSLKAADKQFEFKIYEAAPGGHMFNRLDTRFARESRREVYRFLAQYLAPLKEELR